MINDATRDLVKGYRLGIPKILLKNAYSLNDHCTCSYLCGQEYHSDSAIESNSAPSIIARDKLHSYSCTKTV